MRCRGLIYKAGIFLAVFLLCGGKSFFAAAQETMLSSDIDISVDVEESIETVENEQQSNIRDLIDNDPLEDEQLRIDLQQAYFLKTKLRDPDINPQDLGTIFFTLWQHALLQEAKIGFLSRLPMPGELNEDAVTDPLQRPRGIRELTLGGIVYAGSKDWTIWLNGQRVTPDSLPEEAIDLKVKNKYIELKWFDTYTNLIYPIRLRPHQRFNLDTRIFLPGTGAL